MLPFSEEDKDRCSSPIVHKNDHILNIHLIIRYFQRWKLLEQFQLLWKSHNHPSGVAEPSQADCRITQRLQAALDLIDVRVVDHMVVGDSEVISFAERGLL